MFAALVSALAASVSLIIDKITLSRERMALRVYLPLVFVFLFAFTLLLVPTLGRVEWAIALLPNSLFLLFMMIVLGISWNVLFYQSVQKERIYEHEMITMLAPLVTIILAAVFFPEERDMRIFMLALVASVALFFARSEKAHFLLDQQGYNLFLGVILMSAESIIFRELLYSYSPVALYAVRTLILAVFFWLYYAPRYKQVTNKHWWFIASSALFGAVSMLTRLYAFSTIGVIHATLIAIISPLVVFFGSWEILHERIRVRVVIASLVILGAVSWATVLAFN
ncbi:MAG: DMT family transporter [Candidatus Berkelbacteria bacterium]|nr:MAG: DMT family transporter [Candidatus Berkelbacteria bacterium]QQG51568.1 MAG: DMT family transporter [Candidatus Berkelbacteria bacterium]